MLNSHDLETQLAKVRDLESRLTFQLSITSKLMDQQVQEMLKGTPLTLTSYRILRVVSVFDEISISDISRYNAIDRAQVSRTAETLASKGLVCFTGNPTSKRKKMVTLSDAGRALLDEVSPDFAMRRERLREGLGAETYDNLQAGLRKLAAFVAKNQ